VRAPVLPPTVDESIAVGPPPLHSKCSQSKVPGSSLVSRINVDLVLPSIAGTTSGVSLPVAETMTTPVDLPVAAHDVEVDLPIAVPVAVKECAVVPTDEKDVLSKPDPTRVEVMSKNHL